MSWFEALPAVLTALALVLIPGGAVGWLIGVRGPLLAAAAGPLSVAVVGTGAVMTQPFASWSLAAVAATLVVWLAAAWLVGRVLTRRGTCALVLATEARWWAVAGGLGLAILVPSVTFMIGHPSDIAQLHDNAFHLNAVRYVMDSGDASPLTLGRLGTGDATAFYPAAWHDVVSLVAGSAHVPVPVAINAVTLALLCAIWLPGWLLLAHVSCDTGRLPLVVAGLLSGAFSAFPYLLFRYGVVYPWLLALCLLPCALSSLILAAGPSGPWAPIRPRAGALALGVFAGLLVAHPSAVPVAGLLAGPAVVQGHLDRRRTTTAARRHQWTRNGALVAFAVATATAWVVLRPPRTTNWNDVGNPLSALYGAALQAPVGEPASWLLVALVFAGLVALTRTERQLWIFWMFVIAVFLHVASQLRSFPDVRWWIAGVWYEDPFRAASLLPVASMPLVVTGACFVIRALAKAARRRAAHRTPTAVVAAACAALGVLAVTSPAVRSFRSDGRLAYTYSTTSPLLTTHERRLIQRLPSLVPEDAMVAGNPMTGAALGYALEGVPVVEPYPGLVRGAAGQTVMADLNRLDSNPAVCRAVRRLNLQFVLDFGTKGVDGGQRTVVPGLRGLSAAPGFELVDADGPARLYRVTGC